MVSEALHPKRLFQYSVLVTLIPLGQSKEESGNRICHSSFDMPTVCKPNLFHPKPASALLTGINSLPVT